MADSIQTPTPDIKEYKELLNDYKSLSDNNPTLAYELMQRATSLKDYIGEELAWAHKIETHSKYMLESLKSSLSIAADAKNSTNGNRIATADDKYIEMVHRWTLSRKNYERLSNMYDVISDIRFQCYTIWNDANKEIGVIK